MELSIFENLGDLISRVTIRGTLHLQSWGFMLNPLLQENPHAFELRGEFQLVGAWVLEV